MKEGDIVSWKKDNKKVKIILGMAANETLDRRWVRIVESQHPKYRRGMIFILDMNEVLNARLR